MLPLPLLVGRSVTIALVVSFLIATAACERHEKFDLPDGVKGCNRTKSTPAFDGDTVKAEYLCGGKPRQFTFNAVCESGAPIANAELCTAAMTGVALSSVATAAFVTIVGVTTTALVPGAVWLWGFYQAPATVATVVGCASAAFYAATMTVAVASVGAMTFCNCARFALQLQENCSS